MVTTYSQSNLHKWLIAYFCLFFATVVISWVGSVFLLMAATQDNLSHDWHQSAKWEGGLMFSFVTVSFAVGIYIIVYYKRLHDIMGKSLKHVSGHTSGTQSHMAVAQPTEHQPPPFVPKRPSATATAPSAAPAPRAAPAPAPPHSADIFD